MTYLQRKKTSHRSIPLDEHQHDAWWDILVPLCICPSCIKWDIARLTKAWQKQVILTLVNHALSCYEPFHCWSFEVSVSTDLSRETLAETNLNINKTICEISLSFGWYGNVMCASECKNMKIHDDNRPFTTIYQVKQSITVILVLS